MIVAGAVKSVAGTAGRLAKGTIVGSTRVTKARGREFLDRARGRGDLERVAVDSRDARSIAPSARAMAGELGRSAAALDDAREALFASEGKLRRNVAEQAAATRLGQRALEGPAQSVLIDEVLDSVCEVLGVPIAAVLELEAEARSLVVSSCVGLSAETRHRRFAVTDAIEALYDGPVVVEDWAREGPSEPSLLGGAVSGAGVLISGRAGPFGLLTVNSIERRSFAAHEIAFLEAIAKVLADAVERERVEKAMRHRALHDPLTGLANRTLFGDRLRLALAQCDRRGRAVAVLLVDLDQFKLVNDSLGRASGDGLLRGFAARLDESLRPGDTVARFDGDEFVMICDGRQALDEAVAIARRTLALLARPFVIDGGEHFVSASVGIAIARGGGRDSEDLIREADAAMNRAKERGRGRYEAYDKAMRARSLARLQIENELRRALEREELTVHYQPIVSLETGHASGVEALVRWEHSKRGLLAPGEFIAIAEQTGLIVALGELVLGTACHQVAAWHRERPHAERIGVGVNVSLGQVSSGELAPMVARALSASGLDPRALSLELTESVLMDDTETSVETLDELKRLGVTLALDDFGTGYSSLAHVRRFPIDVLKIDRSFVADIGQPGDDTTIVRRSCAWRAGCGSRSSPRESRRPHRLRRCCGSAATARRAITSPARSRPRRSRR